MLSAALELAATKPWAEVALSDIAEKAGASLFELRKEFTSKALIIAELMRAADEEVLRKAPKRSEGQAKRDLLFDVIMTRFDVLAPYKAALKSIHASSVADPSLAAPYLSSQHWMLEAAGIATDGVMGAARIAGLAVTYATVFGVWLGDEDPGAARTMATLDRRLRRGERAAAAAEELTLTLNRFATEGPRALRSLLFGRRKAHGADREGGAV